jgi:hypothetical protein
VDEQPIGQSRAIERYFYLAAQGGLMGDTQLEGALIDSVAEHVCDVEDAQARKGFSMFNRDKTDEEIRPRPRRSGTRLSFSLVAPERQNPGSREKERAIFVLTIGDVGMLGEDEKNDLELAGVGTNDAEGDVDEDGENLAAADVGDGHGSGTIGEVSDRVRKIRVPMILCPKVLNADMSLRASAKAIADVFSVGEWARNDSVFQRPIAIESKSGF